MAAVEGLDRALVRALGITTRPNVLELSRRLGVARNTVQAHIDRLQRAGVIAGFGPIIDPRALGWGVLGFMSLELAQGRDAAVLEGLAAIPEVLEVHKVTGPGDLLCRVVGRDTEHLHGVVERVLALPGVERTTTALVLHTVSEQVHPSADAIARLPER